MNENENPTPDQNQPAPSDAETHRMPEQSAPAPVSASEPASAKTGGRKRTLLISAAAVVAVLAVGGGAYAIGANVGDDDDDRPVAVGASDTGQSGMESEDSDDSDAADAAGGDGQSTGTALPASDAASMRAAAEKAIDSAGAKGVTSIDVERTGYEIEVQLADGTERDLLVGVDGTITTDAERDDDDRPEPLLDLDRLADIEKAALAAASGGGANAVIDSISSSDDPGVAYEVSIRLPDGRDADVELAADLAVVTVDTDD